MADTHPDSIPPLPTSPVVHRRAHTYSRLTTAIAVLALATGAYALWRLDSTRDRVDQLTQQLTQASTQRDVLQSEIRTLTEREQTARQSLEQRLDALKEAPRQLQEFASALEELQGRAEGPERAWSRAEAMFLMQLAQQRLALDRDIDTAIAALEAADSRLASLRDPAVATVRQQLAREIQALRAAVRPDLAGIMARLANAEEQAANAAVLGIIAIERTTPLTQLPEGVFARAWAVARNAVAGLVTVRKIDSRGGNVVTLEEQALRRQHLQLLLYSARAAVVRHDSTAYRSALAGARQWLGEFFDLTDPQAAALAREVQALEPVNIDPPLPDVTKSSQTLQRLMPARRGPE
ncbi:MAG TPA: uroporphyrinogen-III C-methyltransferase [Povalibacter sp.]|uniref:uroporphyrinogen-III C-methyltransferase n=1 Tax=Povalibacter sp. TaxID=1962978 RepID=UPI002BFF1A1F|nr:uroporphyrinogen-III C-methyltransferase [Povalibacter sp.]HMN47380.1 uroporphyrinogen-III C-methyltransferase [Povalibacter sp.]